MHSLGDPTSIDLPTASAEPRARSASAPPVVACDSGGRAASRTRGPQLRGVRRCLCAEGLCLISRSRPLLLLATEDVPEAPASGLRPKVVPSRLVEQGEAGGCGHEGTGGAAGAESAEGAATDGSDGLENAAVAALLRQQAERRVRARLRVPYGGGRRRVGRRRYSWAELLQRAFGIEVLVCPKCSGVRRVLAAIQEPGAIARVLLAMGLSVAVPEQAGCRSPSAGGGVSSTSTRVSWSSGGSGAVTSCGSWRGSGASGGREAGGNEPEAGDCDRLDGVVRGRKDGGGGFRVVRDRSLNILSPVRLTCGRRARRARQAVRRPAAACPCPRRRQRVRHDLRHHAAGVPRPAAAADRRRTGDGRDRPPPHHRAGRHRPIRPSRLPVKSRIAASPSNAQWRARTVRSRGRCRRCSQREGSCIAAWASVVHAPMPK